LPKPTVSEARIERKLYQAVQKAGGRCIKLPAILYRGIPDRLVILPGGRLFFLELKTDRGRASQAQKHWVSFLRRLGFYSDIIYGLSQMERFIHEHIEDPV
jgi:hypothetical protein